MEIRMDEKPPSSKTDLGISTGRIPARNPLARFIKGCWGLWVGDWCVCPIRSPVCRRRLAVLKNIQ